jgi:hypothetical protein
MLGMELRSGTLFAEGENKSPRLMIFSCLENVSKYGTQDNLINVHLLHQKNLKQPYNSELLQNLIYRS